MDDYKVSLIIPCYNISHISNNINSFEITLNSIKRQSIGFENVELILVDDKSKDDTYSILKKLSNEYSNIKIYQTEKNSGGPSIPRNIGIENATADYVMFLDSDDNLNYDAIEVMYNSIIENESDIVKLTIML